VCMQHCTTACTYKETEAWDVRVMYELADGIIRYNLRAFGSLVSLTSINYW